MRYFIKYFILAIIFCVFTPLGGAVYFYDFTTPVTGLPTAVTYNPQGGGPQVTVSIGNGGFLQPIVNGYLGAPGIASPPTPFGVVYPAFFQIDLTHIWPLSPTSVQFELFKISNAMSSVQTGSGSTSGVLDPSFPLETFSTIFFPGARPLFLSLNLSMPYNANPYLDITGLPFSASNGLFLVNLTVTTAAPEPATIALLGSMIGIAVIKMRKRCKNLP